MNRRTLGRFLTATLSLALLASAPFVRAADEAYDRGSKDWVWRPIRQRVGAVVRAELDVHQLSRRKVVSPGHRACRSRSP